MALAVLLVVLDVVRGRLRESLVAWLAMVTLVYSEGYTSLIVWRVSWGQDARHWIPAVVIIGALLLIVRHVLRHQISWDLLWLAAAALCALIVWPVSSDPLRHQPVTWLWQLVLVAMGIVLAGGPLRDLMQQRSAERPADRIELVTSPV